MSSKATATPVATNATEHFRFGELVERWKKDTSHLSNIAHRAEHPAYLEIMQMGQSAIPLLLAELKKDPDDWFWALHQITGADPVPNRHRGDLAQMAEAWLKWGRSLGYKV